MLNRVPKGKSMLFVAAICASFYFSSCKKDDEMSPKDRLSAQVDSLKLMQSMKDSLSRINAAGSMNYTVAVVSGSGSSFSKGGKVDATSSLEGAVVTATQYGRTLTVTTDASGLAVFSGFYRGGITVNIRKEGYTSVSYIADAGTIETPNGEIRYFSNIIPIFELTGTKTAKVKGKMTIETDLTNLTRETVPAGTKVIATIDATNNDFAEMFLDSRYENNPDWYNGQYHNYQYFGGEIVRIAYDAFASTETDANGNYEITVPAAIDGLPVAFDYNELGLDQKLYMSVKSNNNGNVNEADRVVTRRALFGLEHSDNYSGIDAGGGPRLTFKVGSDASATATISGNGQIERINVRNGGTGYVAAPRVIITSTDGNGTGATATATIANGVVTGITLTSAGSGYTAAPSVTLEVGSGGSAVASLNNNGSVVSARVSYSGSGYTTAPTVTFSAAPAGGTTATGTATISNGKVTGITITNAGSGYASAPTVTIAASPTLDNATASVNFSGVSVENVTVTNSGSRYVAAPTVTFSAPQVVNGVTATGTATIDATGNVVSIQVTNPGSGYLSTPTITLSAGSGANVDAVFSGKSVTGINITNPGQDYIIAPKIEFVGGGGNGATGNAIVSNGRLIGIEITNGGTGYTSAPTIKIITGTGAVAAAVVENGKITAINVLDGGSGYLAAPIIEISTNNNGNGAGATATATVANGQITSINVTNAGSGYVPGNTPGTTQYFSLTPEYYSDYMYVKSGKVYVRDVYYGTGARQAQ